MIKKLLLKLDQNNTFNAKTTFKTIRMLCLLVLSAAWRLNRTIIESGSVWIPVYSVFIYHLYLFV